MVKITRNFNKGLMNKVFDERLVPDGQYIDALNMRMGSTELNSIGALENSKGNIQLTNLMYTDGTLLSEQARCIGAYEDGANETLYWFVHDPYFPVGATGKLDLIVSLNILTNILTYHVISIDDGNGIDTTLNFNDKYVITAINKIDNLLFWTDDYNPPRFINVKTNYANPVSDIDYNGNPYILKEYLQVIKQPPIESPDIQLTTTSGEENFLSERFICFAYRYRYADNQYSAISQFTEPAFIPQQFNFNNDSFLNTGMTNEFNTAIITYNTGGPLVVGIDLLFKEMDSNIIKVIEKLDKSLLGLSDNTNYTYSFTNSKIYTILPESEILRLYDNVPLLAKAQTIMGNRMMYGNYLEGYDLIDKNGDAVKFEYYTELNSEDIGLDILENNQKDGNYNIDTPETISSAVLSVDFSGISLTEGSVVSIDIELSHSMFSGSTPFPSQTNSNINVSFTYYLPINFATVYDMVNHISFQEAVGIATNIQTMANACSGITLSDAYNCQMSQNLDTYIKYTSGINTANLLTYATCTFGSDTVEFQFPAVAYVNNITTPTYTVYEYMYIVSAECSFQTISQNQSLHSNRDYEIGIVYMDDFNRSTTTLVSQYNTEHVPCGDSDKKNSIIVIIPSTQIAPYWATRYKFVIKADVEGYETIYTNVFFVDPETNNAWFLLEGENARKVSVGDRLIVKVDSTGAVGNCAYATVLEKESQATDFLTIPSPSDPTVNIPIPAGVYMKIKPNDFNAQFTENSFISPGSVTKDISWQMSGQYAVPVIHYPMNLESASSPGTYIDYNVPEGTRVKISLKFKRGKEGGGGNNCETRIYTLEKTLVSQANYNNMYDWFVGDSVANILNDGTQYVSDGGTINNVFSSTLLTGTYTDPFLPSGFPTPAVGTNFYQFFRNTLSNELVLYVSGTPVCGFKDSSLEMKMEVYRSETTFVFETEQSDTLPDVFYENNLSFSINDLGEHQGNLGNQNFSTGYPAIIDTGFFNCYAFGNGVESYKIRDSFFGNYITLGNRVTSISAEDYRAIRRYADITYSGIYNNESNVNKLNEFNLGLLNYKQLERSFGPIFIMDARQTDVLVLQEDKISYVLTEKNLLSDAGAGGALTSTPEVLGTQIARVEKYGISFNPESYIQWGKDRYFTDVKRGAVINLQDSETGLSELSVISDMGMSTWFRDLFNTDFSTQKLGAYDPYTDEYVLSSNNQPVPYVSECLSCGITQEFTINAPYEYCVNVGQLVGDVDITYNVISIEPHTSFDITAIFNGNTFTTGPVDTSGTLVVDKDVNSTDEVLVQINAGGALVIEVTVNCPTAKTLKVVEVVLTANSEAGYSTFSQWRYTDGAFVGSLQNNLTIFSSGVNPVVTRYNMITGLQGASNIPTDGSTVRMAINQLFPTNYVFDPLQDEFRYLRTSTLYNNNTVDINALISASNLGTTSGGGTYYYSDVSAGTGGDYLYLIWDLRNSEAVDLCYSEDPLDVTTVCCECNPCSSPCKEWSLQNAGEGIAVVEYKDCNGDFQSIHINEGQTRIICTLASVIPEIISGGVIITVSQECGCRE